MDCLQASPLKYNLSIGRLIILSIDLPNKEFTEPFPEWEGEGRGYYSLMIDMEGRGFRVGTLPTNVWQLGTREPLCIAYGLLSLLRPSYYSVHAVSVISAHYGCENRSFCVDWALILMEEGFLRL